MVESQSTLIFPQQWSINRHIKIFLGIKIKNKKECVDWEAAHCNTSWLCVYLSTRASDCSWHFTMPWIQFRNHKYCTTNKWCQRRKETECTGNCFIFVIQLEPLASAVTLSIIACRYFYQTEWKCNVHMNRINSSFSSKLMQLQCSRLLTISIEFLPYTATYSKHLYLSCK